MFNKTFCRDYFLAFVCLYLLTPATSLAVYHINSAGGQCSEIGVWDITTGTCTLTEDINEQIIVDSSLVTINGDGHTLDVTENSNVQDAIKVSKAFGVTIKNLVIKGGGINIYQADAATIKNNDIQSADLGVYFFDMGTALVEGNSISDATFAVDAQNAYALTIRNNVFTQSETAIKFSRVDNASIESNKIIESYTGLDIAITDSTVIEGNIITRANVALSLQADESDQNRIVGNHFSNSNTGIDIRASEIGEDVPGLSILKFFNRAVAFFKENLVGKNLYAQVASSNVVVGNNFVGNSEDVNMIHVTDILFSESLPVGGNYWDSFDESSEGCDDIDQDGYCDSEHEVTSLGFIDEFPKATPVIISGAPTQCADGLDNDSDGAIDYPADPGCIDADDILEINVPEPTCTLSATPGTIELGDSSILSWTSTNSNSATIDNGVGGVAVSGETSVSPDTATTYTANFSGSGGQVDCQTTVVVTSPEPMTLGEKAANLARELVDQPEGYLWGGKGWDFNLNKFVPAATILSGYDYYNPDVKQVENGIGVDCSGLIAWAYNLANDATQSFINNFIAYENAAGQATDAQSVPVAEADLLPGDTLYFDFNNDGKIDHTAMYVGDQGGYDVVNSADSDLGILSGKISDYSNFSAFKFYRRPTNAQVAMAVEASSPVDLIITDPEGNVLDATTIDKTAGEFVREISDELYYSESVQGHDGNPADIVYSPKLKEGMYTIKVVPNSEADPNDVYSVTFTTGDSSVLLADKESITSIPRQGFTVEVSHDGGMIEEVEVPLLPETLFAQLHEQIDSIDFEYNFIKQLLKLKLKLAEKFYEKNHVKIALLQLKQLKHSVSELSGRFISKLDAKNLLMTIDILIETIDHE